MDRTDKNDLRRVVFEHHGALGDMLLAWPAGLSLFSHFRRLSCHYRVRPAHAPFFAALPATPCPPELTAALDGLYGASEWPPFLAGTLVVRPGLARRPDIPESPNFFFMSGVLPGRFDPPRELYREALAHRGIPWRKDWLPVFRRLFRPRAMAGPDRDAMPRSPAVLLFPGAGHVKKTWPMERFLCLAETLARHGHAPAFVLGPAEVERGVDCGPWPRLVPKDLRELAKLLCAARAVVGADCGPMHLAGMLGIPGVSVFGPTSPRQWGPVGMAAVRSDRPCAPCVQVTSGDFAPDCAVPPPCLADVPVARVREALPRGQACGPSPPGGNHFPRIP